MRRSLRLTHQRVCGTTYGLEHGQELARALHDLRRLREEGSEPLAADAVQSGPGLTQGPEGPGGRRALRRVRVRGGSLPPEGRLAEHAAGIAAVETVQTDESSNSPRSFLPFCRYLWPTP